MNVRQPVDAEAAPSSGGTTAGVRPRQGSEDLAPVSPRRRQVFVSYKSEDAPRVLPLVRALEREGFDVWWDRQRLRPGESWAQDIADALGTVGCVVVVWTKRSVALIDKVFLEEVRAGCKRNVLVPVLLDALAPPAEFAQIQCVDLIRWRGSSRDPCFRDLAAAAGARMAGLPVPPAQCARRRLARRLLWGAIGGGATAVVAALFTVFAAQDAVCSAPWFQPALSDACGALGVGRRPSRAERVAWAALPEGDCPALRSHVARFPDGALRVQAEARLATRVLLPRERWVPDERQLLISTDLGDVPRTHEVDARTLAMDQARREAETTCGAFSGREFRFDRKNGRADIVEPALDCRHHADGYRCRLPPTNVSCQLERREVTYEERCGP